MTAHVGTAFCRLGHNGFKNKRTLLSAQVDGVLRTLSIDYWLTACIELYANNGGLGMNGEGLFHEDDNLPCDADGRKEMILFPPRFVWEQFLDDDQMERFSFDMDDTFGR